MSLKARGPTNGDMHFVSAIKGSALEFIQGGLNDEETTLCSVCFGLGREPGYSADQQQLAVAR